jgi:hypothetical protein
MVEMASYKSFGRFKILNSLRIYLLWISRSYYREYFQE